jgi:hypothetical protein
MGWCQKNQGDPFDFKWILLGFAKDFGLALPTNPMAVKTGWSLFL